MYDIADVLRVGVMRENAVLDALARSYQDAWNSGEGRAIESLMLAASAYHDVPSQQIFRGSQIGTYLDAVFRTPDTGQFSL
jgi:hypothetical protein